MRTVVLERPQIARIGANGIGGLQDTRSMLQPDARAEIIRSDATINH